MVEQDLQLIRKVIPHNMLGSSFIAGGAAIAPQSAEDIDVWVFTPPTPVPPGQFKVGTEADELQTHLRTALRAHGAPRSTIMAYGDTPNTDPAGCPQGLEDGDPDCEKYRLAIGSDWLELQIRLLLTYTPPSDAGKKLQFLSVSKPQTDIFDLLRRFDISSQAWATPLSTTGQGLPYSVMETSTLPSALPRVARWTTPTSTLSRLIKLCGRYGWDIRKHPDLFRLQNLIATASGIPYNERLGLDSEVPDIPF